MAMPRLRPLATTYTGLVLIFFGGALVGVLTGVLMLAFPHQVEPFLRLAFLVASSMLRVRLAYDPGSAPFYAWTVFGLSTLWVCLGAGAILKKPQEDRNIDDHLLKQVRREEARGEPLDPI
jgi:hypothetical protein